MPLIMVSPYRKILNALLDSFAKWDKTKVSGTTSIDSSGLVATTDITTSSGAQGAIGKATGKWYWEVTFTGWATSTMSSAIIGAGLDKSGIIASGSSIVNSPMVGYLSIGRICKGNGYAPSPYPASYAIGDVIGVAMDADTKTVTFYKNGVLQKTIQLAAAFTSADRMYPIVGDAESNAGCVLTANFGGSAFKYPVPAGYNAGLYGGPDAVIGRKFRFLSLGSTRGAIGVHEFEMYDSLGRNLCRTAGFIPTVVGAPGGGDYNTYPPTTTIDGDVSNWSSTVYLNSNPNGSMYLEYTFPVDINPIYWRVMPEGTWLPSPNPSGGVGLQMLGSDGKWIDITGTPSDGIPWSTNTFKRFNIPAKI